MPTHGSRLRDASEVLNFGFPTSPHISDFSPTLLNTNWRHINSQSASNWIGEVPIDLNSREFRSDEFLTRNLHNGEHILFAGCSNTFGQGLFKEETWAHKVYTEIAKDKPLSGYFNIGYPGISITQTISWIFKYIREFGNPDTIFVLLPDAGRFVGVSAKHEGELFGTVMMKEKESKNNPRQYRSSKRLIEYFAFEMYSMLETYCLSSGINLISSSWTEAAHEFNTGKTLKDFETFFLMDPDGKEEPRFVYEYIERHNPETKLRARDQMHGGEPVHAYWALKMLQQYYGENYENPWN